jgi:acetyl-CoA carboxylase biotin carboxyl carrier protein
MDLRKLKTLIELVESSGISELEVTEGEEKVRIVKTQPAAAGTTYMMAPQSAPVVAAPAAAPLAPSVPSPAEPSGTPVKAPMVGTFYRSGSPGAKVYVEVGSEVKEGDVLCIIEAMKLMNEIVAEKAGVVRQILVENGQPVEYGQVLFIVD